MAVIGLSFKNDEEDIELYKWINEHSNLSGFIKDTLRAAKEGEKPKKESNIFGNKKIELIDMDF
jgi:hypothetical protein